jgi:SAM-dependent methyltransferase
MYHVFYAFLFLLSVSHAEDLTKVFEGVYQNCVWGKDENNKGTSGSGSEVRNAIPYINYLTSFLKEKHITSVVDAGCGDWQFSKLINWDGINYTGWDASESTIEKNKSLYSKENINFFHGDFIKNNLPSADLLILKDVLQHLSNENIAKVTNIFSNFKYVIVVNDVNPKSKTADNHDINNGDYRWLDITKAPFKIKASKEFFYQPAYSFETKMVLLITNN